MHFKMHEIIYSCVFVVVFRVAAYTRGEGLDKQSPCSSTSTAVTDIYLLYNMGWKDIKSIDGKFKLNFNNSNIVTYFIN